MIQNEKEVDLTPQPNAMIVLRMLSEVKSLLGAELFSELLLNDLSLYKGFSWAMKLLSWHLVCKAGKRTPNNT